MSASSTRWLALVHRLPCVVCLNLYGRRTPCAEAHHIEFVRGEHSDFAVVPLCKDCHDGLHQARRRAFYMAHKLDDVKLLAWTARSIEHLLWNSGVRLKAAA